MLKSFKYVVSRILKYLLKKKICLIILDSKHTLWCFVSYVSFSSCQRNLIKTFQIEGMISLIKKNEFDFFMRHAKNSRQNVPKSDFQSQFSTSKIIRIVLKKFSLKNINLGAHFLFLLILCKSKSFL